MSITSRINEMSSHIEQAYDELQGLGADLTNVNKNIENISMVLDDIYDSMPQVSGEGTSLTLDDTRVGKIKSTLKGNTSQSGTPTPTSPIPINVVSGDNEINVVGKNLFDKNNANIFNGFTNTANNKLEANNNTRTICFPCQSSTTYTISKTLSARFIVCETSSATISANIPTTTIEANSQAVSITGTTKSDTKYLLIFYYLSTADTLTENQIRDSIQIEKGSSASTYEPYQGNTYNIDLPVENLLDLTSLNPNQVGQQVSNIQENSFIMSGTAVWGNEYFFYENTNKNTTYTASCKYLSSLARKSGLSIYGTNETTGENLTTINSLFVDIPANVETPVTNTFNSGNYDYIVFRYWNNATATTLSSRVDLYVKEVQLEKGSKQNSFTPYGTTPIELCRIGNYQDYFYKDSGKWYLHKEIGKVVLNGTETGWSVNNSVFYKSFDEKIKGKIGMFSNFYSYKSVAWTLLGNYEMSDDASTTTIFIKDTDYTTATDFKAMLANNLPVLYYVLATPTNEEITYQPLIDQLNAIEKAMSKDGQTNISQVNNDLPFIISASALKEWQESTSLNSTLSMVNPLSLGNTLNTQKNNTQPIEVDNIEPLEEEENEES